ncbi:MAG: DUF3144 domain-containing protein [Gammaproteobacteria bacterium]|nr:DUF3144 domain-containing protein [Gammaproteobacteria bacterium]MCB1924444.1 DUF3144 domain-containing protein [Gammaproteobacteria bacterium]
MQEEVFHEVADEFIHLANQLSEDWAPPLLSAAMLYAAARYNAFIAADQMTARTDDQGLVTFLCEQYRKMLEENLRELAQTGAARG